MNSESLEHLRRIRSALTQHDEERLLAAVAALIEAEPVNAALLIWTRFHSEEDRYFRRVLAYSLAKTATHQSKYLWAPLAEYVATLHSDDEATLVNTLTAIQTYDERDELLSAVLAPIFGGFALSCTSSGARVVNSFCDVVVELNHRGLLASLLSRSQVRSVRKLLETFIPSKGHSENDSALAVLRASKFVDILPDFTSRLDQEDQLLDREPPMDLDGSAASSLLHSVLANARSSYALRQQADKANGVTQEVRLTGSDPNKGRLTVEVFEKLFHSWKTAIRDAVQSVAAGANSKMTTYLLAPAQGSFVMRFLVETGRDEAVAQALDDIAELIVKPEGLSSDTRWSPETRSNIVQFAEILVQNKLDATVGTLDPQHFQRPRKYIVSSRIQLALREVRATRQGKVVPHQFIATLEGANRRLGTFEALSEELGYVKGDVPTNRKALLLRKGIGSRYNFGVEDRVTMLGTGEEKHQWVLVSLTADGGGETSLDAKTLQEPKALSTNDVPQQDLLDRIIAVVRLLAREEEVHPRALGMEDDKSSRRHIGYMRQAARILGLVADDGMVTEAGRMLATLPESRVLDFLSLQFEMSTVGRVWKAWAGVEDLLGLDENSAIEFLLAKGLSDSMAKRRGRTLRKWLLQFKTRLAEEVAI